MISVVMATCDNERDLIGCLAPLVPASVEGMVRELVVADAGSKDATLAILEEAGAVIVSGGIGAARQAAKGAWILEISPTVRLPHEWLDPVRRWLEAGGRRPVRLVRGRFFPKTLATLTPTLGGATKRRTTLRV